MGTPRTPPAYGPVLKVERGLTREGEKLGCYRVNKGKREHLIFPYIIVIPGSITHTADQFIQGSSGIGNPGNLGKLLKPWKPLEKPCNFFY